MTFVLIPGAWLWEEVVQGLRSRGHEAHALTLSGLEFSTENSAHIGLQTHVQDVMNFISDRDLTDVILVGHSYSGVLAGVVTESLPERIAHTVFVEAFIPQNGKSLLETAGLDVEAEKRAMQANDGCWAAPTRAELEEQPYLTPEQIDRLMEKSVAQPGRTVTEPARLTTLPENISATYISSHRSTDDLPEPLRSFKASPTWLFERLEGGHWPMLSKPAGLTQMLSTIAALRQTTCEEEKSGTRAT